jgi:hypothetical protein
VEEKEEAREGGREDREGNTFTTKAYHSQMIKICEKVKNLLISFFILFIINFY